MIYMRYLITGLRSKFIYDGTFTDTKIPGQGLATEYLRNAGFTVLSEEGIVEAAELLKRVEAT